MLGNPCTIVQTQPCAQRGCIRLHIDPHEVSELLLEGPPPAERSTPRPGLRVASASFELLDAVAHLMRLLHTPEHAAVLAPLILREINYRALTGELGAHLSMMAVSDAHTRRIAGAIDLIKRRYAEPMRIAELAEAVHMSASNLHHHFKQVTSMSPLQYQKQLRLQYARRMMLTEGLDAASAGYRVGYESPSQFSREYRRLFGAPPRSAIEQEKQAAQR